MNSVAKIYANNQAETSVASSNPRELIIIVYERIFDQLRLGKLELMQDRFGIEVFTKASTLINLGLLASLDYEKGGEISKNLKVVYEWALKAINEGRINKSPKKIQDVIDVLTPIYEGWRDLK